MHPHLTELHDALTREESAQRAAHNALLRLPPEEQVTAGVRWPSLAVEEVEPGRGGPTVVLRADGFLHDGIRPGDRVFLIHGEQSIPGRCDDVGARRAWVRVESRDWSGPSWLEEGPHQVVRAFDANTFIRYRQALERADEARGRLKPVLLGEIPPGALDGQDLDSVDWPGLNPGQLRAARSALAADPLALIHGPPGTGKTTLVAELLKRLVDDGARPWALAESNAATDNLAMAAEAKGLDVVRLGRPARIRSDARHLSLDNRIEAGPFAAALAALGRDIDRAMASGESGDVLGPLLGERRALKVRARRYAIEGASVIASTLGTIATIAAELPKTRWAIVDEATQATEPAIWSVVPFTERLVLVGDPHQLGPVVKSPYNPLERSLLVRLIEEELLPLPMLTTQHRMSQPIQSLVTHIYGGTYAPHPDVARHLLAELPGVEAGDLTTTPTLWIDTAGAEFTEARDPVSRSLYNEGEIGVIAVAVRQLKAAGLAPSQIGVIAPYSAQVARLAANPELAGVEVATVNAFQGREKEAILCSFVRSSEVGDVGFLADPRRLTVALTRARRFWLGVGDSTTLERARPFAPVLDELGGSGAWRTVWEEPWDEVVG